MLDRARQIETDQPLGICYVRGDAAGTTWWDGVPYDGVLCHMALMDIDDQNGRVRAHPEPRRQSRYVLRLPAILAELCQIVHS
jgi:hypothetical protein